MSKKEEFSKELQRVIRLITFLFTLILILAFGTVFFLFNPDFLDFNSKKASITDLSIEEDPDRIENGIHLRTGLVDAEGMLLVVNNCTSCHSAKLVTQNRMTAERWNATIRWMQETQNLWDLGENQALIVNYLVTNYPPKKSAGRRVILTDIDWYELEN